MRARYRLLSKHFRHFFLSIFPTGCSIYTKLFASCSITICVKKCCHHWSYKTVSSATLGDTFHSLYVNIKPQTYQKHHGSIRALKSQTIQCQQNLLFQMENSYQMIRCYFSQRRDSGKLLPSEKVKDFQRVSPPPVKSGNYDPDRGGAAN